MSGADQFHLDVDLDSLRAAQSGLQMLAEHLATVATMTGRVPADVGDGWTGPAATAMKAELAGLGAQSTGFAPKYGDAASALKTVPPGHQDFMTQGADGHWHIKDPGQIYLAKDTPAGRKAWEDFVKYRKDAGEPWLMQQDLYDGFTDDTQARR